MRTILSDREVNMISIIMPAYNADKYLSNAIESLREQTLKEFELIIVNDGSSDNTKCIVQNYQKMELGFKINLINQKNQGQFIARRNGMREALGEFVMFLDADDALRADAVQILEETIKKYKVDCILYNAYKVSSNNTVPFLKPLAEDKTIFNCETKSIIYDKIMEGNTLNNLWLKCFKKEYAEDIPGINRRVNVEEDLAQFLPVIDKSQKIIYLDEYLYYYRENSTSVTAKFNVNHFFATTEVSKVLEFYAKKWGDAKLYEKQTRRYINNIYGSVMQLVKKSCPLTYSEKKEYLFECANNDYFQRKYDEYVHNTRVNQKTILFALVRAYHVRMTLLFGQLIQFIRGK